MFTRRTSLSRSLLALTLVAAGGSIASAQCEPGWAPGEGSARVGIPSAATVWDRDGEGPLPPLLVIGGDFEAIGSTFVHHVAAWDGSSWQPLGDGVSFAPRAFTTFNGDLIAAGNSTPGNATVMRWNGSEWAPLGGRLTVGTTPGITSLAVYNNELYIGGNFRFPSQSAFQYLGRWNGTDWQAVANQPEGGINALHVFNGELIVGGVFIRAGGAGGFNANRIVRWNGTSWLGMNNGILGSASDISVDSLATYDNQLIVGGHFSQVITGNVRNLVSWNGTTWSNVGGGVTLSTGTSYARVHALTVYNNNLFVGGIFDRLGAGALIVTSHVAGWDGAEWSTFSGVDGDRIYPIIDHLVEYQGNLIAGGFFDEAESGAQNVAAWDGANWNRFGVVGFEGDIEKFVEFRGELYGVGDIGYASGPAQNIVRWNGSAWRGIPGVEGAINDVIVYNDNLVVSGSLQSAGSPPLSVTGMARWDGTAWHAFSADVHDAVGQMCILNGDLIVSGGQITDGAGQTIRGAARWNGQQWSRLGGIPSVDDDAMVTDFAEYRGALYAGLSYPVVGNDRVVCLSRWNGANWVSLGAARYFNGFVGEWQSGLINQLHVHNDTLYVAGHFDQFNGQAFINIVGWQGEIGPVGSGLANFFLPSSGVRAMGTYRGELIACGDIQAAGAVSLNGVAAWNGTSWRAFGSGGSQAESLIEFHGDLFFSASIMDEDNNVVTSGYGRWRVCCAADFNTDGVANSQDFFDFVAAFFTAGPNADFNHDGVVNSQDFFDFVAAFFSGCP